MASAPLNDIDNASEDALTSEQASIYGGFTKSVKALVARVAQGLRAAQGGYADAANALWNIIDTLHPAVIVTKDDDGNKVETERDAESVAKFRRGPQYKSAWSAAVYLAFGEVTDAERKRLADGISYHLNKKLDSVGLYAAKPTRAPATKAEKVQRAIDAAFPTKSVKVENSDGETVKVERVNEEVAIGVLEQLSMASGLLRSALTRLENGADYNVADVPAVWNPIAESTRSLLAFFTEKGGVKAKAPDADAEVAA